AGRGRAGARGRCPPPPRGGGATPCRAAAAITLKPPPAAVCVRVARTSPPRSGSAGTLSTTSTTTLPRCNSLVKELVIDAGPYCQQIVSERAEVQVVDLGHGLPGAVGKPAGAVAGSADGTRHGGDRAAVPTQGGGDAAGEPGVAWAGGGDGERRGNRLLGGQAGAHQPVHGVDEPASAQPRDQA